MTATEPQTGVPQSWVRVCQLLLAAGAAAFVFALATGNAGRAWHSYQIGRAHV